MSAPKLTPAQARKVAVARGHLDERTGTGRRARTRTCPTCRQPTLVGDDAHVLALTATVDPRPVYLDEYALAIATGRHVYACRGPAAAPELLHLDRWRVVTFIPPMNAQEPRPDYTVHIEHECNYRARLSRKARRQ